MSHLNVIEMCEFPPLLAAEEDFFDLYRDGKSYIVYIRNYAIQTEYIILSHDILARLPEHQKSICNVYFRNNFHILRQFKSEIKRHILQTGSQQHFYYLFDASSITDYFEGL